MASIAMGLNLGSSGFCRQHTKNKGKTNTPTIFVCRVAFYACLPSLADRSRCRWYTYLSTGKTQILGPMPESRWRRFLDLLCISMISTHIGTQFAYWNKCGTSMPVLSICQPSLAFIPKWYSIIEFIKYIKSYNVVTVIYHCDFMMLIPKQLFTSIGYEWNLKLCTLSCL